MRALSIHALSSASLAALAFASAPALAQTETQQTQAQQARDCPQAGPTGTAAASGPGTAGACQSGDAPGKLPETGAPADQTIVVTGSRIARPNFDTLQPSVIVDSKTIENRGFETLGQAINEQPSFGVPGSSPVGAGQAGSFGSGQSFVDFLGLGSQRTLVLVNGRRFVSSNTASIFGPTASGLQVDLNTINTKLVDRVETIAIGGAPIYGSDAIAGTVNIILKRNYQGVDLDAQYGISMQGDAPNYRLRGLIGRNFADGRGNITVSGEYNRGRGLVYNDRDITASGRFYDVCPPNSPYKQCLYNNRRIPSLSESGIPTVGGDVFGLNFPLSPSQQVLIFGAPGFNFGVNDAAGNQLAFNPAGQLVPIQFGTPVGGPDDFSINFSGGNGFNLLNTQQMLTDTKRYNANLLLSFEFNPNLRLFGEGWYAHSEAVNLRSQPVYNSGLFDEAGTPDGPIILSVNNPYLTAAQRTTILNSIANNPFSDQNVLGINQNYFYLSRANTDIYSGRASSQTDLYRGVLGLDGKFHAGWREFNWEIVGNYGETHSEGREPALVQKNFANAVNAVKDSSGNIVCAPGYTNATIATISSTCAPLNLFGNQISQAALDYISAIATPSGRNKQMVATASIAGPIARLPGGNLQFALGYEHRYESTSFDPGAFYRGEVNPADPTGPRLQYGRSVPINPVSGSYHTDEGFGEITAPIVAPANNVPLVYRLEFHGAARYVQHSTAGGDWTYTIEGRWAPVRDIAFRGNFTHAIRAPAITELFNPSSTFFDFAVDPCDQRNQGSGPAPSTRQKNCTAAGVPAGFNSLSSQRSFHQAIAGNTQLNNERSNAWSAGVVLTPRFIQNLRISGDYLDIRLRDAITSFSASQVVAACYDASDYPNNQFCSRVQRDAAHQLSFIETSYFNAAQYRYRGFLGALDYRVNTPFLGARSRVGFNVSYQHIVELSQRASSTSAPTTVGGTLGYSKDKAVFSVNYENGPFLLFTSVNYYGPADQGGDEPANYRQNERLHSVAFVNGGVSWDLKRFRFRISVDNILNTKPPYPVPAFGGVVTYFPGVLGRYFRAGAAVSF